MKSIEIASGVRKIGRGTFNYCKDLKSVTVLSETPPELSEEAFYKVDKEEVTIYVPEQAVEAYKAAEEWNGFKIEGIDTKDKEAAANAERLINKIGKVEYTEECKAKIEEAREAYDGLTEEQKAMVDNLVTLDRAEETYKELATRSAVKEIRADEREEKEAWYEIGGRRLTGRPTRRGMYIHNGKLQLIRN